MRPAGWPSGGCVALTLLVLVGCGLAHGYTQPLDLLAIAATSVAIVAGALTLGWSRRRQSTLTAPQAMLVLGTVGMVLGLRVDAQALPLGVLTGLCDVANRNLWTKVQLHAHMLPWMHVGMWAGGLTAMPLLRAIRPDCRRQYCARLVQNLACSAWMTAGMSAGVWLSDMIAAPLGVRTPASMLGGMFSGMVWGMVMSVALYRLYFRLRAPARARFVPTPYTE